MLIGIIGAPNKGKSTFFSAITATPVQMAEYPFTTIEPNKGIGFVYIKCPCSQLGLKCCAKECDGKVRGVGIELMDVAGLVPNAHKGKGMGNQFLDDLASADGFIQVVDASQKTDLEGNVAPDGAKIEDEVEFLKNELKFWVFGIIKKNYSKFGGKKIEEVHSSLSGIRFSKKAIEECFADAGADLQNIRMEKKGMEMAARCLVGKKKMVVGANKADLPNALENARNCKAEADIVACSAEYERALKAAAKKGFAAYRPGADDFEILEEADEKKRRALEKIREFVRKNGGTGVQECLEELVFEKLGMIVVFPVEDENKYCDSKGNVLPDAVLLKKGSTVFDLAEKVHTEIAQKFVGAVDARTKRRVSKNHELKNGDIVKIIRAK